MKNNFDMYDLHYARVGNKPPDWEAADMSPEDYACKRPWLPKSVTARILDFGCGWGHQLLALWCAGYKNIEGVELVSRQARTANECAQGRFPILCMDGREYLIGKEAAYDLIILNDVFEHIPPSDALELLLTLKAALRRGGTLVIRVPNMANIFASYSYHLDITHVAGYTEYSLMQILDQAGFVAHRLVLPDLGLDLRRWRPWIPWRGLNLRTGMDYLLHKGLYWLRGYTKPCIYGTNIEMYSKKPMDE